MSWKYCQYYGDGKACLEKATADVLSLKGRLMGAVCDNHREALYELDCTTVPRRTVQEGERT